MKNIKNLHMGLILLAFLATVGILFGGQALIGKMKVDNPLKREVLSFKGVQSFSTERDPGGIKVNLKLAKVKNLQDVLDFVDQKVQDYQNKPVKLFNINDHPSDHLKQVRYEISFYLEEAIDSGHYIQLKEELNSFPGINAKVYIGRDHIYIQLEEGANYLYEALPRPSLTNGYNQKLGGDSA
jgi:hypothetical protein